VKPWNEGIKTCEKGREKTVDVSWVQNQEEKARRGNERERGSPAGSVRLAAGGLAVLLIGLPYSFPLRRAQPTIATQSTATLRYPQIRIQVHNLRDRHFQSILSPHRPQHFPQSSFSRVCLGRKISIQCSQLH
jgi:hypothetical protein